MTSLKLLIINLCNDKISYVGVRLIKTEKSKNSATVCMITKLA